MKHPIFLLLVIGSLVAGTGGEVLAKKPNILFILIDDLGWKDLRCQGNESFHTPNIDKLASQGMRFTDAYAAAPVCSPTRAAAVTGLYPARLKITQHGKDSWGFYKGKEWGPGKSTNILPLSQVTIAERLKSAGYETSFIGKWHLSGYGKDAPNYFPDKQGFDINIGGNGMGGPGGKGSFFAPYKNLPKLDSAPEGEYLPYRLADEAIERFKYHAKSENPFLMFLWHYTVHWPIEAPDELYKKYSDDEMPPDVERYQAMVEGMDLAIGKTLKGLDELGMADDTLIVFTSDNGHLSGYTSAKPLRASKGYLYEGGIRVPLIVRWPGKIEAGSVNPSPVSTIDYAPTFMEAAGMPYKEKDFDGESLVGELTGEKKLAREALFFHYPHYAFHSKNKMGSVIRQGPHKLIYHYEDNKYELYNLEKDISEKHNLIEAEAQIFTSLKTKLDVWLKSVEAEKPRLKKNVPAEELSGKKK